LQLQLGQPGPHLQRESHAFQAAVRHARRRRLRPAGLLFVRRRRAPQRPPLEPGGAAL
ncbi:mCG1034337, partial [Mus musculus]